MYKTARILETISNNKKIKITYLAELLSISKVTLRKELIKLEKQGIVNLSHGYVSLDGADDTGKRIAFDYLIKRNIAKQAAQIVDNDETIMIGSGSCCALFGEELSLMKKNITIITYSTFITNYLRKLKYIQIILLGGYFQPETQMLIGPMTIKHSENFHLDKFFLGTTGFTQEYGFTGRDHLSTETSSKLTARASKIFILTESEKFNRRGTYNLLQLDKLTGVFTDDNISKENEDTLIKNNVQVFKIQRKYQDIPPHLCDE